MALGIRDDALEHSVEHEELLHLGIALPHEQLALAEIGDLEQGLELLPLGLRHLCEGEALPELEADGVALWVVGDRGHCGGSAVKLRIRTNRRF